MKAKEFIIDDSIYKFNWLVIFGGDLQSAINSYCKKINIEPWKADTAKRQEGHFAAHLDFKNGVIWFKYKKPCIEIIAHECFHAVVYFADKMGLDLTSKTEETFAYYLQMLVREVTAKLK